MILSSTENPLLLAYREHRAKFLTEAAAIDNFIRWFDHPPRTQQNPQHIAHARAVVSRLGKVDWEAWRCAS